MSAWAGRQFHLEPESLALGLVPSPHLLRSAGSVSGPTLGNADGVHLRPSLGQSTVPSLWLLLVSTVPFPWLLLVSAHVHVR